MRDVPTLKSKQLFISNLLRRHRLGVIKFYGDGKKITTRRTPMPIYSRVDENNSIELFFFSKRIAN